jgi:hypothetical protein
MKKILLFLCLLLISTASFATANFTSATGIFLVPNVSVNGTANYESVTLQLDLSSGTFSVLDATLKDTSFSDDALETLTSNGLKIDFFGCAMTGHNQISCKTKVVSLNNDQRVVMNSFQTGLGKIFDPTLAFDNLGRQYTAITTAFDTSSDQSLTINVIQGVPAEVQFIFNDIDIQATSISVFKPKFLNGDNQSITGNFRNINF